MKNLIFCILLLSIPAHGSQSNPLEILAREPASMLDVLMLRLQDFIIWTKPYMVGNYRHNSKSDIKTLDINAIYSKDKSEIEIFVSIFDRRSSGEQMRAGCNSVLAGLNVNLYKGVVSYFSHVDGTLPHGVDTSPDNLAKVIKLSCIVVGNATDDVRYRDRWTLGKQNG